MCSDQFTATLTSDLRERVRQLLGDLIAIPSFGAQEEAIIRYLVNNAGIPTVILGPGDIEAAHQANEHISIEQMALGVEVYLKTIEAWMKDESAQTGRP